MQSKIWVKKISRIEFFSGRSLRFQIEAFDQWDSLVGEEIPDFESRSERRDWIFEDWQCQSGSISRPLNRTAFRSIWIFQVRSSNHRVRTALVVVPYYSSSVTELWLLESQVRRRICVGAKRKVRANWVRRLNITWKRVKLSEQCSAFNLLQTTALLESLVRRTTETVAGSLRRTQRALSYRRAPFTKPKNSELELSSSAACSFCLPSEWYPVSSTHRQSSRLPRWV